MGSGSLELAYGGTVTEARISTGGVIYVSQSLVVSTTVSGGGAVDVLGGGVAVSSLISSEGGDHVYGGGVASGTTLLGGAETIYSGGLSVRATVSRGGSETVSGGGTAISATVSGGGALEIVSSGGVASDTVTGDGGYEAISPGGEAVSTIIATSGALDLLAGGSASGGITFSGSDGTLVIGGTVMPTTTISSFADSDGILLASVAYASANSAAFDSATDVVTVSAGGTEYSLHLAGDYGDAVFSLSASGSGTEITVDTAPCFAAGTRLLTDRGEMAVESLQTGDHVMTVEGDLLPITWIGYRHVDCLRHPDAARIWPVRIDAQAFGLNEPRRDLTLSPDHAIYREGVLIPVKYLLDGRTIRQLAVPAVTYVHVELPRHSVIFAEGLPVESYLDVGDRPSFANGGKVVALHPAFATERPDVLLVVDALGYAPLRVTGTEVDRTRMLLAAKDRRDVDRRRATAPRAPNRPKRISKIGRARLRSGLYMPAMVAMRHNIAVAATVARLRAQGRLTPKQIVVAATRKLPVICCGVLQTGRPFDATLAKPALDLDTLWFDQSGTSFRPDPLPVSTAPKLGRGWPKATA